MTTPTTPKAGDITEEIVEIRGLIIAVVDDECDEWELLGEKEEKYACKRIDEIIARALAKQKESIKEQLSMEKVNNKSSWITNYSKAFEDGWNRAVDVLNKRLDNL